MVTLLKNRNCMHRRHYIRFFISSTFADMEIERDLLVDIFKRLAKEYQRDKGWIVEYVDLRWGITEKDSRDNRTMGICKAELKRCQELSPRPNFIVLVGERYGWIPLPETVPNFLAQFINIHTDLIKKNYRQDFNNISYVHKNLNPSPDNQEEWIIDEGPWILKPFEGEDLEKRREEIEEPLQEIFEDVAKGFELSGKQHIMQTEYAHSATEQEISCGALQVEDANSHVVAYLRTLSSVPNEKKQVFQPEENSERVKALREKLDEYLDSENVICQDLDFEYYKSGDYSKKFIALMESHIRRVIDAEITRTEASEPTLQVVENDLLNDYIRIKSGRFWGRQNELMQLRNFVVNNQDSFQLWISGERYVGKSALATQAYSIANLYNTQTYSSYKICVYYVSCGLTTLTSTAVGILDFLNYFISKDFCHLKNVNPPKDLVENRKEDPGLFNIHNIHFVLGRINKENNIRLILVIDNIDKLSKVEISKLRRQNWKRNLNERLKIIYTCSGIHEDYFPGEKFQELQLRSFEENDSIQIIDNLLSKKWRRISEEQKEILVNTIQNSNCTGSYLNTMAYFLSSFVNSWTSLNFIPKANENIYEKIIKCMVKEYHHDEYLIWIALTQIALTEGINDQELTDILSKDKQLRERSLSSQFHKWKDNYRLPPIYWHRLAHDLKEFVSYAHVPYGEVNQIITEDFRDYILRSSKHITLGGNSIYDISTEALYDYYKDLWLSGNMRALYDLDQVISFKYAGNPRLCLQKLIDMAYDLRFTARVVERYGNHVSRLFDKIFTLVTSYEKNDISGEQLEQIQQLRNWLIANSHLKSRDLMLKAYNESEAHPIKQCITDSALSEITIENVLRNSIGIDCVVFQPVDFYQRTVGMSQDSMRLISIDETGRVLNLFDRTTWQSSSKKFTQSINIIKASDEATRVALSIGTRVQVYDTLGWKSLTSLDCKEGKISNLSISHDGRLLAFTLDDCFLYIWEIDEDKWVFQDSISNKIKSIDFSISDNYLWLLGDAGVCRVDFYNDVLAGWNIPFLADNPETTELLSSSDGSCLIKIPFQLLGFFVRDGNAHCYSYAGLGNTLAGEGVSCAIARADNTFTVSLDGLMWDLHDGGQSNPRNVHSLHQITKDGKYGIDDWCVIYDIDISAQKVYQITTTEGFIEVGLNCASSDIAGSWIVLSACKAPNREQEQHIASITLTNCCRVDTNIIIPPFVDGYDERVLTSASAVSPDGTLCAFTDFSTDSVRLLMTDRNIHKVTLKSAGEEMLGHKTDAIRSLYWTQDSQYVVGTVWHHIANTYPHVFLFNRDGDFLKMIPNDEPGPVGVYDSLLTANNKYAIQCFGDDFCIVDLAKGIQERTIKVDDASLGILHPSGKFLLFSSKSLLMQELIGSYDKSNFVLSECCGQLFAISPSGRYIYMSYKGKDLTLICLDLSDGTQISLDVDARQVIPTFDDKYIYVRTWDDRILLIDRVTTQIVQEMYAHIAYNFIQGTRNGLMIATISGSPMLLKPRMDFHVNQTCYTTAVRRFNLRNNSYNKDLTAICPHCGREIGVPNPVLNILSEVQDCHYDLKAASNPILYGHSCPLCNGNIIYNYYRG